MARRISIVWNPSKAEGADLRSAFAEAIDRLGLADGDMDVTWHQTSADDPGSDAVEQALVEDDPELVVVAGGDGTVRAAAEAVAARSSGDRVDRTAVPDLGIIPEGTGNLLARNLDLPLGSAQDAFARALGGEPRAIDLGWLELDDGDDQDAEGSPRRHSFAVMAGFGLDAQMIEQTDADVKDKAGWLAYVGSLGRALDAARLVEARIALDGGDERTGQVHTVLIGNCGTLQGGVDLLPDADPSDGLLDLLSLSADGAGAWLDTLRTLVWDNGLKRLITDQSAPHEGDQIRIERFRTARIRLSQPQSFEVDGDVVGEAAAATVRVQPAALRVRF